MRRSLSRLTVLLAAALAGVLFRDDLTEAVRGLAPPQDDGQVGVITGVPRIVDADTVVVAGTRIRLIDIDACEMGQPAQLAGREIDCGAWASERMADLVGGQSVRCVAAGTDRYDRTLAECFLPDGRSINLAAVRAGIAFPYAGGPVSAETSAAAATAAAAGAGVWSFDHVEDPSDYRRAERGRHYR